MFMYLWRVWSPKGCEWGVSGVRGGPRCESRGGEGALSDPRGRLMGAQIMFTRAVWP